MTDRTSTDSPYLVGGWYVQGAATVRVLLFSRPSLWTLWTGEAKGELPVREAD
jgi:hypothetical protein